MSVIDSIQISGVTYTIQGGGVPESAFTAYTASTNSRIAEDEEVTAAALNALDEKIDSISGGGNPTVEVTQAEYDALVSAGTVSANTYYIITDAQAGDLTQYWTSAQTQSAINQATSGKVDSSSVVSSVTSASTDSEIPTAKAVWDVASQGGGGEGTVSALTETNPVLLKAQTYYTATTIDTIYLISKIGDTFYNYYTMDGFLSDDEYLVIYTSGNENGITSVSTSTAFTSTITDGIAEIKFVSPLTLKRILDLNRFIAYYFPPTPYTSGSTSEVVEDAVYDSLRKLSLDVLQKDGINDYYIYTTDNGIGFNLRTDKNYYSGSLVLDSPTINFNGGKINTQFSSTTASQAVINNGDSSYCNLFLNKSYDDITITFNPSYNGSYTTTSFNIYAVDGQGQESSYKRLQYSITNNSISWNTTGWDTYFTVVDTLSTDYKLKIVANTGYKISRFRSLDCLIGGTDAYDPNQYITNLITTTSNIHDGQEVIDDLYTNKQDKLSAGTNITIVDNVISATGGGGTVSSAITSGDTNAVAGGAVYDKFDEVEQVTARALNGLAEADEVAARALIDLNDKFDGLKLKKLTQSQYDALSGNTDSNTLYIIVN